MENTNRGTRKIHEIRLIAFHKNGLGVNVVLVDEEGYPYG